MPRSNPSNDLPERLNAIILARPAALRGYRVIAKDLSRTGHLAKSRREDAKRVQHSKEKIFTGPDIGVILCPMREGER
jgi:hypothetical protein